MKKSKDKEKTKLWPLKVALRPFRRLTCIHKGNESSVKIDAVTVEGSESSSVSF